MENAWNADLVGEPHPAFAFGKLPTILTFPTSLQFIADTGSSVARFGDGEIFLASGQEGPSFQKPNETLNTALMTIVKSAPRTACAIALARPHFYRTRFAYPFIDTFINGNWSGFVKDKGILGWFRTDAVYLDACLTIPRHHHDLPREFWNGWFDNVRAFFRRRNILLVTGDRNAVTFYREFAHDVRIVPCPEKDAWSARDKIKADLLRLNGNRKHTVVFACGPAATVLAWEMADEMQCLDLGHMGKEYYAFKNNENPASNLSEFYGS